MECSIRATSRPSRSYSSAHLLSESESAAARADNLAAYKARMDWLIANVGGRCPPGSAPRRAETSSRTRARALQALGGGPMTFAALVLAVGGDRTYLGRVLASHWWFERVKIGLWTLTDEGRAALEAA